MLLLPRIITHSVLARPAARHGLHAYSGRRHYLFLRFSKLPTTLWGWGRGGWGRFLSSAAFVFRSSFALRPRNRLPMDVAPHNTCRRTGTKSLRPAYSKPTHQEKGAGEHQREMDILSELPAAAGTRAPVINLFYVRAPRSQTQLRSIPPISSAQ